MRPPNGRGEGRMPVVPSVWAAPFPGPRRAAGQAPTRATSTAGRTAPGVLRHRLVLGAGGERGRHPRAGRAWLTWLRYKELGSLEQARRWTHEPGLHPVAEGCWLTRTSTDAAARWRLTEKVGARRWTSTLTAVRFASARAAAALTGRADHRGRRRLRRRRRRRRAEPSPDPPLPAQHGRLDGRSGAADRRPAGRPGQGDAPRRGALRRRLPAVVVSTPPGGHDH